MTRWSLYSKKHHANSQNLLIALPHLRGRVSRILLFLLWMWTLQSICLLQSTVRIHSSNIVTKQTLVPGDFSIYREDLLQSAQLKAEGGPTGAVWFLALPFTLKPHPYSLHIYSETMSSLIMYLLWNYNFAYYTSTLQPRPQSLHIYPETTPSLITSLFSTSNPFTVLSKGIWDCPILYFILSYSSTLFLSLVSALDTFIITMTKYPTEADLKKKKRLIWTHDFGGDGSLCWGGCGRSEQLILCGQGEREEAPKDIISPGTSSRWTIVLSYALPCKVSTIFQSCAISWGPRIHSEAQQVAIATGSLSVPYSWEVMLCLQRMPVSGKWKAVSQTGTFRFHI